MPFFLPRVNKCCCCFPLRFGSLVIGYVSMILASLSISGVCTSLARVVQYVKSQQSSAQPQFPAGELRRLSAGQYAAHAYFLLVLIYYFTISLMLVVGVHRNRVSYMRYYFRSGLVLLVLAALMVAVSAVFIGLVATAPMLLWTLILFYCLVVVMNTYLEIEQQVKPRMQYEMQTLYVTPA